MVKYPCPQNNKEINIGKRSRKQLQRSLSKKYQHKHNLIKRRKKLKLAKVARAAARKKAQAPTTTNTEEAIPTSH